MIMERPETVEEWIDYVSDLDDESLLDEAMAVNTVLFSETLLSEGFSPDDVEDVYLAFGNELVTRGIEPPRWMPGSYVNYLEILQLPVPDLSNEALGLDPDEVGVDLQGHTIEELDEKIRLAQTKVQ